MFPSYKGRCKPWHHSKMSIHYHCCHYFPSPPLLVKILETYPVTMNITMFVIISCIKSIQTCRYILICMYVISTNIEQQATEKREIPHCAVKFATSEKKEQKSFYWDVLKGHLIIWNFEGVSVQFRDSNFLSCDGMSCHGNIQTIFNSVVAFSKTRNIQVS